MIQVERSRNPDELRASLRQLLEILERCQLEKLAPDVETWLRRVVRPRRFHGLNLKSWEELKEVTTMLEERVKQWEQELHAEGVEAGVVRGRAEGRSEGRAEGRSEGLRSALRKQFRLKFQRDLDKAESAIVSRAEAEALEELLERILTAEEPSELFPR